MSKGCKRKCKRLLTVRAADAWFAVRRIGPINVCTCAQKVILKRVVRRPGDGTERAVPKKRAGQRDLMRLESSSSSSLNPRNEWVELLCLLWVRRPGHGLKRIVAGAGLRGLNCCTCCEFKGGDGSESFKSIPADADDAGSAGFLLNLPNDCRVFT